MNKERRSYESPVREAQSQATRQRILESVAEWMQADGDGDFSLDAIAKTAGLERRTVFRHFQSKSELLRAFWVWVNDRMTPSILPSDEASLIAAPRATFAQFDSQERLIRASLHTSAGRAMRLATVPERQAAFREALAEASSHATPEQRRRLEALTHLLYSASAWETMRDYAGISGAEAGEAASWALQTLIDAVREAAPSTQP